MYCSPAAHLTGAPVFCLSAEAARAAGHICANLDDAAPVVLLCLGNVQQDLGLLFYGRDIPCSQLGLARHLRPQVCQTGWLNILLVLCMAARKGVRCGVSTAPSGLQKLQDIFLVCKWQQAVEL